MMGMNGEAFVEFGLNFRDRSRRSLVFVGYCKVSTLFPHHSAAVGGGYGRKESPHSDEVGAGEAMVDMAVMSPHDAGLAHDRP